MTTREEPFDATRSLVSAERGEEKRRPGETFGKLERAASLGNQNAAFLWGAALTYVVRVACRRSSVGAQVVRRRVKGMR